MHEDPILVVGTTPDYVARIYENHPAPTIFVLDERHRNDPRLESVESSILLFTCLENLRDTTHTVSRYLRALGLSLRGVACFDCEYLILASRLAFKFGLPFPSTGAIIRARNKFQSRRIWAERDIASPVAALSSSLKKTLEFFDRVKTPIVMKPVSGSGSELLFRCESEKGIVNAVRVMVEELRRRRSNPLFRLLPGTSTCHPIDPTKTWVVEEYVSGPEFSCDFIMQNDTIVILRETGKEKSPNETFGSVLAYTFPPTYPAGFCKETLLDTLKKAAKALGFTWGHFMVDFIIQNGRPVIIEMTPRPGGDSIPDLIKTATGADLIHIYLDFISGNQETPKTVDTPQEAFASINFYAQREGVIKTIDTSRILALPWVRGVVLKKAVGDRVKLPPHDYDNRLLGYGIVSAEKTFATVAAISEYLQKLLTISFMDHSPGMRKVAA